MRWYQLEPTVCMAISMIEMEEKPARENCAKFILNKLDEKAKSSDIAYVLSKINPDLDPKNRFYDADTLFRKSIALLKAVPKDCQVDIAKSVLQYMRKPA